MEKIRIGLIFGGQSAEHEVSLQSAKNIYEEIDKEKYEIILIGINKKGEWHLYENTSFLLNSDNPKDIKLGRPIESIGIIPNELSSGFFTKNNTFYKKVDIVFPVLHGNLGEDGSMQGLLRIANIPFIGSQVLSSSICMDKDFTKRLLTEAGIKVAKGCTFYKSSIEDIDYNEVTERLGTPMYIKPANQGSSIGVSKVQSKEEFTDAIHIAFKFDNKIIIEESIEGREIECAVLGNDKPIASLPGEILAETGFYSYTSKYIDENGTKIQLPATLSDLDVDRIQELSKKVYNILECRDLARVDMFLTKEGKIYINEINTLPGFTKISMYPKLWEISGIPYSKLIDRLIGLALER